MYKKRYRLQPIVIFSAENGNAFKCYNLQYLNTSTISGNVNGHGEAWVTITTIRNASFAPEVIRHLQQECIEVFV